MSMAASAGRHRLGDQREGGDSCAQSKSLQQLDGGDPGFSVPSEQWWSFTPSSLTLRAHTECSLHLAFAPVLL